MLNPKASSTPGEFVGTSIEGGERHPLGPGDVIHIPAKNPHSFLAPKGKNLTLETNMRIVKFSKDGKFLKAWGRKGSAPGELSDPHSIAFDSKGRLFVADRANRRIQIFTQNGEYIDEWKQFGRPVAGLINAVLLDC
jgi:hypothetical protein